MKKSFPLLITESDVKRRDYVFKECQNLIEIYKTIGIIGKKFEKSLEKYKSNKFKITIFNENMIYISFIEENEEQLIITTQFIRKIKIFFLKKDPSEIWFVNEAILNYYLEKIEIKYPIFQINNLDYYLNEENIETFVKSYCNQINENDLPDISFDEIQNHLYKDYGFSDITLANNKYFLDSYNQDKFNDKILSNTYEFNKLIDNLLNNESNKEIKVIKNSKSGFSSMLYYHLKSLRKNCSKFCFFYIDLRFFNNESFTSKEKTEILLKEAVFSVKNKNSYNNLKKIIMKFNNYSKLLKKIDKIINFLKIENNNVILVFDHFNFEMIELNEICKPYDSISILKIFSLEESSVQDKFLEQTRIKPHKRDYYIILNYPQIKQLSTKYVIYDYNPYYYGLKKTSEKTLSEICENETIRIFNVLQSFYKNNIKNLFELLSFINFIGKNGIKYSNKILHNIPLDLFKIELNEKDEEMKIEYKNYLIQKTIQQFIRKKFISNHTSKEFREEMISSNIGLKLETLFNIFYTSDKLPFSNIKYISELILDKINNSQIIIDKKNFISNDYNNENIFISQDNDIVKFYGSALILNLENKKILKIYQVIEGDKNKILIENYTKSKLKQELENIVFFKLEKSLKVKFDIIEFKFVLDYQTYKYNTSNVLQFCKKYEINYILFDYKNFLLYDKDRNKINQLEIDKDSIIIDKTQAINKFHIEEELSHEKESQSEIDTISNIENNINDINNNLNNNSIKNLIKRFSKENLNKNLVNNDDEYKDNILELTEFNEELNIIGLNNINNFYREIEVSNGVKIGISTKEKINSFLYFKKRITTIVNNITEIDFKCKIKLYDKISIGNLINILKLKNNELIHACLNKIFYLIFFTNKKIGVFLCNWKCNYKTKIIKEPNKIILDAQTSIYVFDYKKNETEKNI